MIVGNPLRPDGVVNRAKPYLFPLAALARLGRRGNCSPHRKTLTRTRATLGCVQKPIATSHKS